MNTHLPFAVVGSNEFVKVGNKNLRARQYPWGVVQVGPPLPLLTECGTGT